MSRLVVLAACWAALPPAAGWQQGGRAAGAEAATRPATAPVRQPAPPAAVRAAAQAGARQMSQAPALGGPHTLKVEVRGPLVRATIDSDPPVQANAASPDLAGAAQWKLRDPDSVGILVWDTDVAFSEVKVVEVQGTGKIVR